MALVPANDKIEEIQESGQLENPYDVPTPLLNIRNRSPKTTRKSERNYPQNSLKQIQLGPSMQKEEHDHPDEVKSSLCHDISTRILILLCDTDLENACHAILRKRGKEEDRQGYLQYLVKRFIFPTFPAIFCWILTIVGKSSFVLCSFVSSIIWYLVSFLLILYTFSNLHNSDDVVSNYSDKAKIKEKKIRSSSSIFSNATKYYYKEHYNLFSNENITSDTFLKWLQVLTILSISVVFVDLMFTHFIFIDSKYSFGYFLGNLFFGIIAFIALPLWFYIQRRRRDLSTASKYQPSTPIATVSYITLFLCLICSYVSYNTDKNYWGWITPLFFVHIFAVLLDANKNLQYNFQYVIFYCSVMLRTPDFLGHAVMHYHDMIESYFAALDEHEYTLQIFKVLFSLIFLVVMTLYVVVLKFVVQRMSTKYTSSRFLYVGQLYYYMFWYLLIVEEKPTDWTFWAMLLLQNLNYILMNTGVYEDLNSLRLIVYKKCVLANSNSKKRKLGKRNSDLPTANDEEHDNSVASSSSSSQNNNKNKNNSNTDGNNTSSNDNTNDEKNILQNEINELQYRVQVAENDHLADTTALIVVVTTTILWVILGEKDVMVKEYNRQVLVDDVIGGGGGFGEVKLIEIHQKIAIGNLLIRFVCTFVCRLISQRISHLVFALKERCLERRNKAQIAQSSSSSSSSKSSPKTSRRRGRDSLANLQFGEAKEMVNIAYDDNNDGDDDEEKQHGKRTTNAPNKRKRKQYLHRASTVQTMTGVNIPKGAAAIILEFEDSFWFFLLTSITVSFSCLQYINMPVRLAFCRQYG